MSTPTTEERVPACLAHPTNPDAWEQLLLEVEPPLYKFFSSRGLQDSDARDLTQTTLLKVVGVAQQGQYNPDLGSFNGYLFRIAQNNLNDFFRAQGKVVRGVGSFDDRRILEAVPDPGEDDVARLEAQEHLAEKVRKVRAVVRSVRGDVRPREWKAFWMAWVEGKPVPTVARKLGIKPLTVYRSKYKIAPMIRKIMEECHPD